MKLTITSNLNDCPPNEGETWSAQGILKQDITYDHRLCTKGGKAKQYFHAWASTREAAIEKVVEMAKSYREEEVEV